MHYIYCTTLIGGIDHYRQRCKVDLTDSQRPCLRCNIMLPRRQPTEVGRSAQPMIGNLMGGCDQIEDSQTPTSSAHENRIWETRFRSNANLRKHGEPSCWVCGCLQSCPWVALQPGLVLQECCPPPVRDTSWSHVPSHGCQQGASRLLLGCAYPWSYRPIGGCG